MTMQCFQLFAVFNVPNDYASIINTCKKKVDIYMSLKGDAWVDTLSTGPVLFLILYVIFFYSTVVYVYVGLWRSASKYIERKKRKKQSAFWGYATYVWMILAIINIIREFFR